MALILPAASVLLAAGWHVLRGNPTPSAIAVDMLLPNAALNLALGPLGEELGWRGTLLPRLRLRTGVFAAGLAVRANGRQPPTSVPGALGDQLRGSSSGIYSLPAALWLWAAVWWMLAGAVVLFERSRLASPVPLRRLS